MRITFFSRRLILFLLTTAAALAAFPAHAQPTSVVIDDFENDAVRWTFNDNIRNNRPGVAAELVSMTNAPPGAPGVANSQKSGLFTFKSATHAWASANIRISGKEWAENGAQRLTFYLNASGNQQGFEIQLRRLVSGQNDEVFKLAKPVLLNQRRWRKVVIPLSDFKSNKGSATNRLNGIYLLQIVMRGSWDTRFFSLDQLQVEGVAAPVAAPQPPKTSAPSTAAPTKPAAKDVSSVSVDYLKLVGGVRSTADTTIGAAGAGSALPLVNNRDFRIAIRELKPSWVRLDAGELSPMVDSSRPSFDFTNLVAAAKNARSIGAKVLLTISDPLDWGLDADGYAAFAVQAARAVNRSGTIATSFELATMDAGRDIGNAVIAYNTARSALKKVSSAYDVGGITTSSRDESVYPVFLAAADGLDFLTIRDFGRKGDSKTPSSDQFSAVHNVSRLSAIAHDLDTSRWRQARIFVITNLETQPSASPRAPLLQMPAAAWWGTYLMNVSRLADQIFHNDATNPQWGLLDVRVRAFPSYYAMWMWNTFVPPGSQRVATEVQGEGISAMGVNTPTAHNLMLANTTATERTAEISIRGFPVLRQARIWLYDNPEKQPYLLDLPNSPTQTVKLAPYAVAVVQFIEPPKK